MRMARIGATAKKGGVSRQTLTDVDREARDLFISWCRNAGCSVRIDPTGNIFARRAGRHPGHGAVLAGSHLGTQPAGGKFDGAYGVLAALEGVRTLNDVGHVTERPIEVVAWTNQEGCRFAPSMMGSGVFSGQFDSNRVAATTDEHGRSFGADGDAPGCPARCRPHRGSGSSYRPRASAGCLCDRRPARHPPELAQHHPGARQLQRRPSAPGGREALVHEIRPGRRGGSRLLSGGTAPGTG